MRFSTSRASNRAVVTRAGRLAALAAAGGVCCWGVCWSADVARADEPAPAGSFRVVIDPALRAEAYSGRVYIALSKQSNPEPRRGMWNWFRPMQVLATDVRNIGAGQPIVIGPGIGDIAGGGNPGAGLISFPKPFGEIPGSSYFAQAIVRVNPDSPSPGAGAGDLVSDVTEVSFTPGAAGVSEIRVTRAIPEREFKETDRVKLVEFVSPSLSKFYGREVKARAGVLLPSDWRDDSTTRHPTIYWIGGFGGDHFSVRGMERAFAAQNADGGPGELAGAIIVVPDPTCFRGHSVFADSANNGPRGESLVNEIIPEVEKRFHGSKDSDLRFVTGMSSGGWASLWLQITYPDTFNGVWSHCPDPVDFRDFQQIDLYAPGANMYRDEKGNRRPLARQGGRVSIYYDDFVKQESVMGPGGQIHSFEAVFSPKGANGEPMPLFDRATGAVDSKVAKAWEAYDINLIVERTWDTIGPKLKGKIHIYAGEQDTFYLEGATMKLAETLKKVGSDAQVTIVPGMAHAVHRPGIAAMMEAVKEKRALQAPPEGP
jgi:S-formylglutathione hydrolase FrmB